MSLPEFQTTSYQFLREYVESHTGIELGPDKQYLVESRLESVLVEAGCKSLADLCRALHREQMASFKLGNNPRILRGKVVHALSTHETSFFRDPDLFAGLRKELLPGLIAANPLGRLRVWSAAASSGQEVYSLAILFTEMGIQPPPELIATDVSAIILEFGSAGFYTDYELSRGMEDPLLRGQYFVPQKGGSKVSQKLRQLVDFRCFDLREPGCGLGLFDLIFCRNVLIYFEEATRHKVIEMLRGQLRDGGILILGSAEAIWADMEGLERISVAGLTCYRRNCQT